ncbi:FUN14 domain-containing protein 1B isoform X2 [Condylostylus longicornis]|uniref:FUN14 domain-containing protein 1B isoform X2 n=1 Tax=Condylostylus longicornis TaxID=2530218 RepID=UPI00244E14CF|nr:FUN14 domain-containing protein 1B isoform X2 [Condylostylus longicornis]
MSATWSKSRKNIENKEIEKMADDASKFLGGILGDISNKSAYTQIGIGAASGWLTGFTTMKVGKLAAFAIGGTIILVEIAHHEGFISIDWAKVNKKLDKVSDKVETAVTGQSPSWIDKIYTVARDNKVFSVAFLGGVFLGISCS